jgi:molybdate transport system substrate-binding protein
MRRRPHQSCGTLFVALLASVFVLADASSSARAAEIKLLSLLAMTSVIQELGPQFETRSGHKLTTTYGVDWPMMGRIDAGEKFDAIITVPGYFHWIVHRGKFIAASRVDLARVGLGMWIRAGAPKPDIGTVDAFKRVLLEAKSIGITKESGGGLYAPANAALYPEYLMQRLGITEEMRGKTKLLDLRAVAAGDVQYGISAVTDGLGVPGVELLGLLPHDIGGTRFLVLGGVAVDANDPAAARAFLDFLRSSENAPVLKQKGWEPVDPLRQNMRWRTP